MNVLIDGISTHYIDEGQGPIVLLMHGWGGDLASFNLLADTLAKTHRVLRFDLPGMGATGHPPNTGWDVYSYAAFASRFLSKVGVRDIQAIVGHSMGGRIAIKALSENIIDANKLVLIASAGIKDETGRTGFYKILAKLGKILTFPFPHSAKKPLKKVLYTATGATDYLEVDDSMKNTFKKVIDEDLQHDAEKISKQTLLIYGTDDEETPVTFGQTFNGLIKNSKLEIIVGGDHFVHLKSPEVVNKLVEDFLA